jgi:hypothetical protein
VDELARLLNGFQVSQAIYAAATLGIADLLAGGPRTADELAAASGANPDALYRLLRALASVGVFRELEGRRFELTSVGDGLRSDASGSLLGWAKFIGRTYFRDAWSDIVHSVRTGENAFRHVHGTDPWTYRAARPEESAIFDDAMMALTRHGERALLDAYDFGRFGTVVDVAGGRGALLAAVLERYPNVNGVLFDQPHVVDQAEALGDRCRIVAGSFFDSVPEGGDAYMLKMIVHDWEDEDALRILRNIAAVLRPDGAVLVIERQLGGPNENARAKFGDLNMLISPGGRERTTDEYAALFAAAGLRFAGETPAAEWAVYEARR